MFSQLELAVHRAKFQHATSTPAEQARQLAALQTLIFGLLGLGTDTGGGAVLGSLGGPGAGLGDGRQN